MTSQEDAKEEVCALWVATFGELPPIRSDVKTMLQVLIQGLPIVEYASIRRFGTIMPPQAAAEPPQGTHGGGAQAPEGGRP